MDQILLTLLSVIIGLELFILERLFKHERELSALRTEVKLIVRYLNKESNDAKRENNGNSNTSNPDPPSRPILEGINSSNNHSDN